MGDTSLHETQTAWTLISQNGPLGSAGRFPLVSLPSTVGRRPGVEMLISDPSVSGRHAEFFVKEDRLFLRDLKSTNGTFVNGKQVTDVQELKEGDLVQFAKMVFRMGCEYPSMTCGTYCSSSESLSDWALALSQFDRLITEKAVVPYYQPIVSCEGGAPVAYEVLGRSRLFGLDRPTAMFRAASQLNQEAVLSRLFRTEGVTAPNNGVLPHLFLNTHPAELNDLPQLIISLREIRRHHPQQPVTLEIHESAVADPISMKVLRLALTDLRMGLAYDDFGVGQARLVELAESAPDIVKFDMRLLRNIHMAPQPQQRMLASLVRMVVDMGSTPLAEGIECEEERMTCMQMGFKLFQGYYFGRPSAASHYFGAGAQRQAIS